MATKAMDLFQAYSQNLLPQEGGYIVSSFFSENSAYSIYDVIAYSGVKSLYLTEEGLTFQTDGNKMYVLVEPASYSKKHIEPVSRETHEQVPHRFKEMEIFSAKNQTKVMVSKKPIMTYSSFTVLKPTGINFAILFYNLPEVLSTVEFFFTQTLNKEAGVPTIDAKKAAKVVIDGVKKFTIW
jgi:hypothetical protein